MTRKEVRVFKPGALRFGLDKNAELGRLHVTAQMQPGVSGGAPVVGDGRLIGIAVGGGEGRIEAIPLMQVQTLMEGLNATGAANLQAKLGVAFKGCAGASDTVKRRRRGQRANPFVIETLAMQCLASRNLRQHL